MADDEKRDWNSTAAGWKKWHAVSEKAAQSATENMLNMAGVSEGDRVIDFATGLGDTAIVCDFLRGQERDRPYLTSRLVVCDVFFTERANHRRSSARLSDVR